MQVEQLVAKHPILFHMAEDATWPSIQRHGLLSTRALVDLYDPAPEQRAAILNNIRRTSIALANPIHGIAVVRDQGPLKFLDRVLEDDTTVQEYLDQLNGRVFFWATQGRLLRLMGAKRYRKNHQTVLHVDTRALVAAHPEMQLAGLNTGSVHVPNMPTRGKSTFKAIEDYPYDEWRQRPGRKNDALVEVTVPYSVPHVRDCVLRVERWHAGQPIETLYQR